MATGTKSSPSESCGNAEGHARNAGADVDADEAEQQAEQHHRQRLGDRAMREDDRGDQAEHQQTEILDRGEFQRQHRQSGTLRSAITIVAIVPAKNEARAAMASAVPALPCLAIS